MACCAGSSKTPGADGGFTCAEGSPRACTEVLLWRGVPVPPVTWGGGSLSPQVLKGNPSSTWSLGRRIRPLGRGSCRGRVHSYRRLLLWDVSLCPVSTRGARPCPHAGWLVARAPTAAAGSAVLRVGPLASRPGAPSSRREVPPQAVCTVLSVSAPRASPVLLRGPPIASSLPCCPSLCCQQQIRKVL